MTAPETLHIRRERKRLEMELNRTHAVVRGIELDLIQLQDSCPHPDGELPECPDCGGIV